MLEVAFTPKGTKLLDPADKTIELRYHNGPVIEPAELATLPDYRVLASFADRSGRKRHTQRGDGRLSGNSGR